MITRHRLVGMASSVLGLTLYMKVCIVQVFMLCSPLFHVHFNIADSVNIFVYLYATIV